MKQSEKIISAILTMVVGVLLITMKDNFISILMTIAGGCLIVVGVVDACNRLLPPAVIKIVSGLLLIICGWAVVRAVLYIVAALLLVGGILLLYDKIKRRCKCEKLLFTISEYATIGIMIFIGFLLLFHQAQAVNVIFIVSGVLTIIEGGLLLANAFNQE